MLEELERMNRVFAEAVKYIREEEAKGIRVADYSLSFSAEQIRVIADALDTSYRSWVGAGHP